MGVGDLKRVLTNVKVAEHGPRSNLELSLSSFSPVSSFERNVCVKADTSERVEFCVRLPGPTDDGGSPVWLPIDSKFPHEDYARLQAAADRADSEGVQTAVDALGRTVRAAAKDIHDRYVNPPQTTDFGIMFLATEGLYAEVLRQPALVEEMQRLYRVVLAGPTTLVAILSSLRLGFQTLAIQQQASEVWRVLGAVKTEFAKFGGVLDKVKKQLDTATRTIEETGKRSRAIERKLRSVEQLPQPDASEVLALSVENTAIDDLEV